MHWKCPATTILLASLALTAYGAPTGTGNQSIVDWDNVCKEVKVYDERTGTWQWKGARGRYFCDQPKDEPETVIIQQQNQKPQETKKPPKTVIADKNQEERKDQPIDCLNPDEWVPVCGFVPPSKEMPAEKAFEFQAKQRDKLFQTMVMRSDDLKATRAVQHYMKWVSETAYAITKNWSFNQIQDPELDRQTHFPTTGFGQDLLYRKTMTSQDAVFEAIKDWQGALVMFYRDSCSFCHEQLRILQFVKDDASLPLYIAPLERECDKIKGNNQCISHALALQAAKQVLSVEHVPALFLYIPNPQGETPTERLGIWIRVSNGLESAQTIQDRIFNFAVAWRQGVQEGLSRMEAAKSPSNTELTDAEIQALFKESL